MDAPLKTRILSDLKDAFRSGDATRKTVLSLLNAGIKNEEIEARVDARAGVLSDADILALVRREIKQHEESLHEAKGAGRADLVAQQTAELTILRGYLPAQLTREQITEIARAVIAEVGAKSPKQQGDVMKALLPRVKDNADGKLVSEVVRGLLT
ncbi:MAG: GatB/YqeY domain-containing protein [Thermoflexales bacterium]|nr:GatB/YqeY domain-containing protein [Thermoflexales bacterium]